jgi:hypothetical protein
MHGLELLKKGAIWRIGDGSQVRIWRGNWLPRSDSLKVSGKMKKNRLRWVSELIDPERMIREYFYPHDVEAILAIKLTQRSTEDFVAWNMEDSGIFTVRSAYRLGLQPRLDQLAHGQSSSYPLGDRPVWDAIWKAKVPQKNRIHGWKAATDTLAVRQNVHRRISTTNPTCSICGNAEEDVHHALIGCTLARALRDGLRGCWSLPPESELRKTGKDWFIYYILKAQYRGPKIETPR